MANEQSREQAQTALEAVEAGDLKQLRALIKAGVDVNESEESTALSAAAEMGRADLVRELLKAGADVNFGGIWVPLCAAVRGKNLEVVKLLLAAGATVDAQEEEGSTALMDTAALGNLPLVKLLVKAGANPKLQDEDGTTAIIYARQWPKVVEYLKPLSAAEDLAYLEKEAEKSSAQAEEFVAAAKLGDLKKVEELLAAGVPLNGADKEGNTPLHVAAALGRDGVVKALLTAGADLEARNKYGRTPFWLAADYAQPGTAKQLINAGADVNARERLEGKTPFLACLGKKSEQHEMMRLLAKQGADLNAVDEYGRSALTLAQRVLSPGSYADEEDLRNAEALRAVFVELKVLDPGAGRLIAAAGNGDGETVRKLVASGVSPDAIDEQERTALYMAVSRHRPEVVEYLLQAGADLHKAIGRDEEEDVDLGGIDRICPRCQMVFSSILRERQCPQCGERFQAVETSGPEIPKPPIFVSWSNGFVPLMAAAKGGDAKLVRMLIDAGAKVDCGKEGITPLMTACYYAHIEAAKVLIEQGADVNKEAKTLDRVQERVSAVKIAANARQIELVKLLWEAGVPAKDKQSTLLVDAARQGDTAMVKQLLAKGADVNQEDPLTREWPLIAAAKAGCVEAVEALVKAGALVNPPSGRQASALALAVSAIAHKITLKKASTAEVNRYVETVKKLLQAGAKANLNYFSFRPLAMAEEAKCEPLVELLRAAVESEKSAVKKR